MKNKFSAREIEHINSVLNNEAKTNKNDANYDRASAESNIKTWKSDMERLKDHIAFLERKYKHMEGQLADAEKKYKSGDYLHIIRNLYTLGDLY